MNTNDHNNEEIPKLIRYPVFHKAFGIIIQNILQGLFNNLPVHIGIDNYAFVKRYKEYRKTPLTWWEDHISIYRVVGCSVAVSSVLIQLNQRRISDIFEEGTYFYNCVSGSFEITIDPKGLCLSILAEFDGKTPNFIPQLLQDFPDCGYPSKDELLQDLSNNRTISYKTFLRGLRPMPYRIIEVD